MSRVISNGDSFTAGRRLSSVFLALALLLSHPVAARDLHYCSHTGEFMEQGRGCSSDSGFCCAVKSVSRSASCCQGSEEKRENPVSGLVVVSPGCSDCCQEYRLAGFAPPVAAASSSAADIEITLGDLSAGFVESRLSLVRATLPRRIGPTDRPTDLPIYLLTCRFLI